MSKKRSRVIDAIAAGARLAAALTSTFLGGYTNMTKHNYPQHAANVARRGLGKQRWVDGVWVDDLTGAPVYTPRPVVTPAATAAAEEKKLLETEEIIDKYWRRGDPKLSRAAVILTRPYCRSLGDKIDYWTQYENWYKELSEMNRVHDNFDPENWARDYVVKMKREGHWSTLNEQKFEAIVKKHAAAGVGRHAHANANAAYAHGYYG